MNAKHDLRGLDDVSPAPRRLEVNYLFSHVLPFSNTGRKGKLGKLIVVTSSKIYLAKCGTSGRVAWVCVCVYIERELTNASALAEGKSQGCTASPLGIVMALNG